MAFFWFDSGDHVKETFRDTNKYSDDFELVDVPDQKGRLHRKAVYRGVWYLCRNARSSAWKLTLTAGCALLLPFLHISLLLLQHFAAGKLAVMLPLLLALFPELYLLMGVLALPFRGKPQRRDQYMHSFIRVSRSATAILSFTVLALLASFLLRFLKRDWLFLSGDLLFLGLSGGILILALACLLLLHSIPIAERENSAFESPLC